ncbi:hypothetical protein [Flavobacterium subsaxonicum]|uniref:Uncharacterized protein n=1 Tax=Flavobacterium subsaxonicum WB 4.1-42 = DSM 21790 TaxID=1121898 RepID=A0A0A2MSZ8_9FLAO|nr:hypothetical protein [Flavobacterium subsaxonicum]KGO91360.1 hypothetical protein Q766_18225 [Flavobacterium subsaxonicum WB 4.1-42 = DSM 21790]
MKNVLLALLFFTCGLSQAQVSVNVNIGTPPAWGPAGYTEVRYYYLPDIEVYYDINTAQYIYINNGNWVRASALPTVYKNYNLYNGYKVVVNDYRGTTPYVYYKDHKVKYPKGYKGKPQKNIGTPPGLAKKSVAVKSSNKTVVKSNGKGNGKNNGNGKGHGNGKGKN